MDTYVCVENPVTKIQRDVTDPWSIVYHSFKNLQRSMISFKCIEAYNIVLERSTIHLPKYIEFLAGYDCRDRY